jgi:hypothetical protein
MMVYFEMGATTNTEESAFCYALFVKLVRVTPKKYPQVYQQCNLRRVK